MSREISTPEQRELYRLALRAALVKGHEVLNNGGEAMDAAVAAVGVMEGGFNHALNNPQTPKLRLATNQIAHCSTVQKALYSMWQERCGCYSVRYSCGD